MRDGQFRRWVAAAVIAAVTLLSVPAFANEESFPRSDRGLFAWIAEGWGQLVSVVLAGGLTADPNGGPVAGNNSVEPGTGAGQPAPQDASANR